jgi:DNA-binding transcriptional regulator LsrR (DeoR family)
MAEVADLLVPGNNRTIDVVPLMGESASGLIGTYSQVNLHVLKIARAFNGNPHFLLAPLLVQSKILHDLLMDDEGISSVTGYWDRLTHVCLGVGTLPPIAGEIVYIGDENIRNFREADVIGDVCSRYFDRQGWFIDNPIYQRMIGIQVEQMRKAAHFMAVASGQEKAAATASLLRNTIITDLFIDEDLARAILLEMHQA